MRLRRLISRASLLGGIFAIAATTGGCTGLLTDLMVKAPNYDRPLDEPRRVDPGRLEQMNVDEQFTVEVGPPDQTLLVWRMDPPDDAPIKGTVLLVHGWRNEMSWMMSTARGLARGGYRVILMDLRGHGGSTGRYVSFGVHEARDLVQLVDELERRRLIEGRLGAWGLSMGASTVIQAAAIDERIEAVVAAAAFTSMREVVRHIESSFLPLTCVGDGDLDALIDAAAATAGYDADDADALDAAPRTDAPILIIHGKWDMIVPHRHGMQLYAAAKHSRFVSLPFTGHAGIYFDAAGDVRRESLAWFDRHLQRTEADDLAGW